MIRTSFISEHSIEYSIIQNIIKLLEIHYDFVIPIFPWTTREGNRMSREIHEKDFFRVLSVLPRRPKFEKNCESLFIEIKSEFISMSKEATDIGIPFLLGCPLINNIWSLKNINDIFFFNLSRNVKTIEFNYNKDFSKFESSSNSLVVQPQDIIDAVNKSTPIDFANFIHGFRAINRSGFQSRIAWNGSYKPVYFLIRDMRDI